jgi:glucosylceramidase
VMAAARGDVAGIAEHCYFSDHQSMQAMHSGYPEQLLLETECSSYLSSIYPAQMAIRVLRNGGQGVQLWNAAIDQHFGPKIGNGCRGIAGPWQGKDCIAPVIVNTATHSYSLTSDYWALAQFSKFVQLGAKRIDSTDPSSCTTSPAGGAQCGLEDVAFRNPDGSRVLIATAHDGKAHTLSVTEGGAHFSYVVPDGATVTFVWPAVKPVLSRVHLGRHGRVLRLALSEDATVYVRVSGHRRVLRFAGAEGMNRFRLPRLGYGPHRLRVWALDPGGDRSRVLRRTLRVR